MKQLLLAVLLLLLVIPVSLAQDIIMKRSGEKIEAKVLEITPTEVKYKRHASPDGPVYTVLKNDISVIQYADNTSESFEITDVAQPIATTQPIESSTPVVLPSSAGNNVDLYAKGQSDAITYYDGYKPASTGTLVTSLLSPLIGLIPAVACSATTPRDHSLDAPSHELLAQPNYKTGYKKRARKIKSGKVWKNWAIGLGVNVVLAVLIAQ
ncbi:hypothetical protein [Pontibacter oryzae]|uniref:Uncharacterized protein n=1 Tax=Pontibacter oryzae TaxID=2304593 RepID=A0A399SDB9_9BACT|nr:hypothetical protein [Pontibacter oryzae]RIJ41700.1 hypothetical protein D1627_06650 [Pontibacter oryzae]